MLRPLRAAGDARDVGDVAVARIDARCDAKRDLATQIAELQHAEAHFDRVGIVLVVRPAHQLDRLVAAQTRDDALPALERHADDLREERRRVADRGEAVVREVLAPVREQLVEQRTLVFRSVRHIGTVA